MRALTADQKAALRAPAPRVDRLLEVRLEKVERYWSGSGLLDAGGHTWLGCGAISAIRGVSSDTEARVNDIEITVAALPAIAAGMIRPDLRGYSAFLYDVQLGPRREVIGPIDQVDEIALDTAEVSGAEDGSFYATIRGQSGFWTLEDPIDRIWSDARIREDFPDETGLDLLSELEGKVIPWTKT